MLWVWANDALLKRNTRANKVDNLFIGLSVLVYYVKFYSKIVAIIVAAVHQLPSHFLCHQFSNGEAEAEPAFNMFRCLAQSFQFVKHHIQLILPNGDTFVNYFKNKLLALQTCNHPDVVVGLRKLYGVRKQVLKYLARKYTVEV